MKNFAKHIPNILTMSRFVFIPFIVATIVNKQFLPAFILLTISGITDILDGFIARKFNFISNFGKLIDPLADKATQLFTLISLSIIDIIPWWILGVIFFKELIMIIGASYLYGKELVVSSRWYGKLTTVVFYIAIVGSLVINFFKLDTNFDTYIYYVALACAFYSLVMYYREFFIRGFVNKEALKTSDKTIVPGLTKEEKIEYKEVRKEKKAEKKEAKAEAKEAKKSTKKTTTKKVDTNKKKKDTKKTTKKKITIKNNYI